MINEIYILVFELLAICFCLLMFWSTGKHFYRYVYKQKYSSDVSGRKIAAGNSMLSNSVRVPVATIAITLGALVKVNKKSRVYIIGHDLNSFFDPIYIPIFKLLMSWVSRNQAQIIYFLHEYPLNDNEKLNKLKGKLNRPLFTESSGGLQFRLLESNSCTVELVNFTKKSHFLLVAPPLSAFGSKSSLKGSYSLWLEHNHPKGKTHAYNCEYVFNANKDERLPKIKEHFNTMLANSRVIAKSRAAKKSESLFLV